MPIGKIFGIGQTQSVTPLNQTNPNNFVKKSFDFVANPNHPEYKNLVSDELVGYSRAGMLDIIA